MLPSSSALPAWPGWKDFLGRAWLKKGMEFHAAGRAVRLEGNQLLKLHNASGTTLQVVCGSIWITQEGDIKDSFAKSGEWFQIERDGETLIAPLDRASLRVLPGNGRQREAALALLPARSL